jgi:hypothetical protein
VRVGQTKTGMETTVAKGKLTSGRSSTTVIGCARQVGGERSKEEPRSRYHDHTGKRGAKR